MPWLNRDERMMALTMSRRYEALSLDEVRDILYEAYRDCDAWPAERSCRVQLYGAYLTLTEQYPQLIAEVTGYEVDEFDPEVYLTAIDELPRPTPSEFASRCPGSFVREPSNSPWYQGWSSDGEFFVMVDVDEARHASMHAADVVEIPNGTMRSRVSASREVYARTHAHTHVHAREGELSDIEIIRAAQEFAEPQLYSDVQTVDFWLAVSAWLKSWPELPLGKLRVYNHGCIPVTK